MNPSIKIQTEHAWQNGYSEGVSIGAEGISLRAGGSRHGLYLGEIIDANEAGHEWSRMGYDIETVNETSILLWTLTLDQLTFEYGEDLYNLEDLLENLSNPVSKDTLESPRKSLKSITDMLQTLGAHCHDNQSDVLLYEERGRYLIYWFELISEGDSHRIKQLEIFYEKLSWLSYLPQIYSDESEFLERYLGVFQTVHEDIERIIDRMVEVYKPETTQPSFLEVLNQWLPVDGFPYWNESQKRQLLSQYRDFNRLRGTKAGILKYVSLYTNRDAYIVEHKDFKGLKDSGEHTKLYERLYSDSPYGFTLLVHGEALRNRKDTKALEAILKEVVPAQVTYKIARLNPYMVLGDYTYLGINSSICNQTEIKLDEQPLLSTGIIGE